MPSIRFDAIIETARVVSGFRDIQDAVRQTAQRVEKEGKTIDDVISNIQNSFNIAIGGWSVGKFVNQMMQVRGQFQQTEMAFKTMLQSEEKANELMKQIIHTAAITPFGVEDVTEGAKQLLAFNVAAEDVNKTLIGLGDVAAGMGLNLSDLVMLYGTTIAKGKMDTQDLYQFLNRGIPIADELAKVMGLDVSNAIKEVQKQIKAGKVTSDIFIQAMQSMTSEGSKFGGLMEAQSKTITGQISNIEDAVEQMFNELGKSQEGVINTGLDIVSKLVDNWETVGKVLLTVVSAYGAYKAAVLTMIAISKAQIALKSAQAFLSLAGSITSAKDAMALFNLVSKSNVLGLVAGAVAAAVAYFNLFGDTVEDAASTTKKFGEDASKATNHVETLLSILKNANKDSKVYKDTIKELSDIYGNYGIAITKVKDDESNLVAVKDEEIRKSQELVEQIRLESAERNRANAISSANSAYNSSIDSAVAKLTKELTDAYGSTGAGVAVSIQNIVTPQEVQRMNELTTAMNNAKEGSKEWLAARKQLEEASNEEYKSLMQVMKANGLNADEINKVTAIYYKYKAVVASAQQTYSETVDAVNKGADATENMGDKAASTTDRVKALEKQLQGAGEDVHTLYSKVKAFMENYSENDVNFHVNFDAKIPSWMSKMDIPELGRLGRYFSALAKDLANNKKNGIKVNGKYMTTDEIAQRGWDYTNAANTKQTKVDEENKRKQRQKEEDEANAKKKKKEADAAKKKAEEQRKAQEELNEDQKQLIQQNIDTEISLMKEGTDKKLAEIKNDYKKRLDEITKQETEFKKKNKEAGKASTLTKEQSDALQRSRDLAKQEYDKQVSDVNKDAVKEELQALNDYLKEFGTIQQQKYAIAKEYDDKIAQAQGENQKKLLQAQKKQALDSMDAKNFAMDIDWSASFKNVGNVLKDIAKETLEKVEAYMKTADFKALSATDKKTYTDLRKQLKSEQGNASSPFKMSTWNEISRYTEAYQNSVKSLISANEQHEQAVKELEQAELELKNATSATAYETAKAKVDRAKERVSSTATTLDNAQNNKEDAQNKLTDSTDQAAQGLDNFGKVLNNITSGSLTGFVKGIIGIVQSLSSNSKAIGSAFGELGSKIGGLIGAILAVIDALGEDPSGFIDDLLQKVIGVIDGLMEQLASGKLIETLLKDIGQLVLTILKNSLYDTTANALKTSTFGAIDITGWFDGNEEEIAKQREELIEEAEKLTKSIDSLKNELSKQSGAKAIRTASELKQQQEQLIANAMKQIVNENEYHSAHHSNASYWNENAFEVYDHGSWTEVTKALQEYKKKNPNADTKTDSASSYQDLQMLTPEQMDYIRSYYKDQWQAIKDVGKYDASDEKWEAYADLAGTLQETVDSLNEALTQTSFDSLKDEFISTLMDMDSSAEDFSDKFSEYLMQAVLSAQISNLMEDQMEAFYKDWAARAEANNGTLKSSDVDALQKQWDALVEQGLAIRDQASKITGYTGSTSQTATSGGWSSMGQDTADELNGRFTALQIAGESIAQNMADTVSQMQSIVTLGISTNGAVLEIRNMMIMTNSYLEDVVKYAKLTYNDFGSKLEDIHKRLKEI